MRLSHVKREFHDSQLRQKPESRSQKPEAQRQKLAEEELAARVGLQNVE